MGMGYTNTRPPLTKCKNFSRRYSDPLFENSAGKDFEVSEDSSSDDDDDDDNDDDGNEDNAIKSQSGQGLKRKVNIRIIGFVHVFSSLSIMVFSH